MNVNFSIMTKKATTESESLGLEYAMDVVVGNRENSVPWCVLDKWIPSKFG